jgi:hypothetical protein
MALSPLPGTERSTGCGILHRLHRDTRGLASIEFVLSAPVILFIVLFVGHANKLSVKKMDTMHQMRSAAFAKANGLSCSPDFSSVVPLPDLSLPAIPGAPITSDSLSCEQRASHEGEGADGRTLIWDDVKTIASEKNASEDLPGELRNEVPQLVTAQAGRIYRFAKRERVTPFTWRDTFTVDDATLFVSDKDVTQRGYDPTLRRAIDEVSSGAGDLFDGIFPGAN